MIKLLNAGWMRLRKSKLLWLLLIFSIGIALFVVCAQYNQMIKYDYKIKIEMLLFNYSTMIGIIIAIFTSLFLGVEYSDGGIRNKISIGHKRINIYLVNLLLVIVTSLLAYISFLIVTVLIGVPLFGWTTMPLSNLLLKLFAVFMLIIAYSSIFTFIAMISSSKTMTAILTILLAFGFMIMGIICFQKLKAPKTIQTANLENGEMHIVEKPNPKYPSEMEKKIYQTLLDMNPAGQAFQLGEEGPNLTLYPIYSVGILIILTGTGIVMFKKKALQ